MSFADAPSPSLAQHRVATRIDWIAERKSLLARERRALPWVRIGQDYVFDSPAGPRQLAELFQRRPQLRVQHFMPGLGWKEGCKSCSFMADHFDGIGLHLAQHDIGLPAVSRALLGRCRTHQMFTCLRCASAAAAQQPAKAW